MWQDLEEVKEGRQSWQKEPIADIERLGNPIPQQECTFLGKSVQGGGAGNKFWGNHGAPTALTQSRKPREGDSITEKLCKTWNAGTTVRYIRRIGKGGISRTLQKRKGKKKITDFHQVAILGSQARGQHNQTESILGVKPGLSAAGAKGRWGSSAGGRDDTGMKR